MRVKMMMMMMMMEAKGKVLSYSGYQKPCLASFKSLKE
jgi:hypothetical protein